jgi:hypothetical protein
MKPIRHATMLILGAMFVLAACQVGPRPPATTQNDWLLNAADDAERWRLLQLQFRGFDQPMWEVGERYQHLHEALTRQNYDLALYHWDKIKTSIENGFAKRPLRRASAENLFLTPVWQDVRDAIASRDRSAAWNAFDRATEACKSCHLAEKVTHMDDQPMFELKRPN